MPLLNPIDDVLHEVGIKKNRPSSRGELKELLEDHALGPDEVLENLSNLMNFADTSATKLQATKIAAELNGLLMDDASKIIPHVTIIINDSEFQVNPILVPRGI